MWLIQMLIYIQVLIYQYRKFAKAQDVPVFFLSRSEHYLVSYVRIILFYLF